MQRIVYLAFSDEGGVQGGHKMIFRHVEALRELGFNAVVRMGAGNTYPSWFDHGLVVESPPRVSKRDVMVIPDDSPPTLQQWSGMPIPLVVFWQSLSPSIQGSIESLAHYQNGLPRMIAVAPGLAGLVQRLYPQAQVDIVPCFADERRFAPGEKRPAVAFSPRKRLDEARALRPLAEQLHPALARLDWVELVGRHETEVARTFASASLHLSLSRFESVGMTPLEAMLSGCVCAGYLGVGGREFGTPENGFWVPDDDMTAAADALAQADDLVRTGGAPLQRVLDAARETAAQWSYAAFKTRLERVWMEIAPGARVSSGPLD